MTSLTTQNTTLIDDNLTNILIRNFNTEDQKLFVQSFKMYLEHGDDDTKFVISLDDIWKWLGFARIDPCKRLLIKHFVEKKDYKIILGQHLNIQTLLPQPVEQNSDTENRGGHNKQTIMMTVNTFNKLCMKASTSRSNDICDYYVKMENVMYKYMKNKLIESKTLQVRYEEELKNTYYKIAMNRHQCLVKKHHFDKIVYVMRLQNFENGSYVIKIGKTNNIKERLEKITAEYKCKPIVMEIYENENPEKFENLLHRHPAVVKYRYQEPINNSKSSKECYLIPDKQAYKTIISVMERHKNDYQTDKELIRLRIQEKELDFKREFMSMSLTEKALTLMVTANLTSLFENTRKTTENNQRTETKTDTAPMLPKPRKPMNPDSKVVQRGPIVQMYDKDDLKKVVRVFENTMEVFREYKDMNLTHLKYAVRHRLLYNDHRWYFVSRTEEDPRKVFDIGNTETHPTNRTEMICMIDKNKTSIEKVFALQKEAAKEIGQSPASICSSIKYGSLCNDKYWMFWSAVSKTMKDQYLESNTLPNKYQHSRGIKIEQIDSETREVIKTYDSYSEVVKHVVTSAKSVKKASMNDMVCSGYRWRVLDKTTIPVN